MYVCMHVQGDTAEVDTCTMLLSSLDTLSTSVLAIQMLTDAKYRAVASECTAGPRYMEEQGSQFAYYACY